MRVRIIVGMLGCPANGKGMSGLQFLSALTKRSQYELKSELIKRAGSFQSVVALSDSNTKIAESKSMDDLFNELSTRKQNRESFIEKQLLDNSWTTLPNWVQSEVDKRKIYKSPYIKQNWQLFYDKRTSRLVIPWTDEYYQLRALTKKQEKESGKYLFPPEIEKPIFGLNMLNPEFKYIFLLEGVFDAIFVRNGCAVGSLKLSNKQKEILEQYKDKYTIVYFMDNQYKDKSSFDETLKIAKEQPWINLFIWPEKLKDFKDVNDTIIASDNFLRLWSNEGFLVNNTFNRG